MNNRKESRKEIARNYQLQAEEKEAGIYVVRNTRTGRVLLGSSLNPESKLNAHRAMLRFHSHQSAALQQDWDALGEAAFEFVVVETVKRRAEPGFNPEAELKRLEAAWIARCRPFEERCYNRNERIRTNPF